MTRYYAAINDVFYYIGSYRTINEAQKRAEIEARRMNHKLSDVITVSVITESELREVEDEHGEQVVLDINEINKAISTIMSVCNKMGDEKDSCDKCPFVNKNGGCGVNYPIEWSCGNEVICNVGDYIYKIPHFLSVYGSNILNGRPQDNRVYENEITSIERDEDGYILKHFNYYSGYRTEDYGKEWFLTREEAEQALLEVGQRYEEWKSKCKKGV